MINDDPLLEAYIDKKGNKVTLSRQITDEINDLCWNHIERTGGKKPSKKTIESWVIRLQLAYSDLIITDEMK